MILRKLKKVTAITAVAALALTAAVVPATKANAAETETVTGTAAFYVSYNGTDYVTVPFGMGTGNIVADSVQITLEWDEVSEEMVPDSATLNFTENTYSVPGGAQTGYITNFGDSMEVTAWDESKTPAMPTSAKVDLSHSETIDGIDNAVQVSFDVISEGNYFASLPGVINTSVMPVNVSNVILAFDY